MNAPEQIRVVVLGGGISGLAAAAVLAEDSNTNKYDVALIEARPRLGGRLFTERSSSEAVELGAQWLHAFDDNPLTATVLTAYKEQGAAGAGKISVRRTEQDHCVLFLGEDAAPVAVVLFAFNLWDVGEEGR